MNKFGIALVMFKLYTVTNTGLGDLLFKAWGWRDFFPSLALFCSMLLS